MFLRLVRLMFLGVERSGNVMKFWVSGGILAELG
jgi:hypothetical protein